MQNLHFVYQKEILDSSFIVKDRIYSLGYMVNYCYAIPPSRRKLTNHYFQWWGDIYRYNLFVRIETWFSTHR